MTELKYNTWLEMENGKVDIALLPWGSTEPHNRHLPYGTDSLCSERVAVMAADIAAAAGIRTTVLPVIPFGVNTGQRDLNMCISIRPAIQYHLLKEVALAMKESGVPKLMIVNGHGGNNFKPLIRQLSQEVPEVFCCFTNWWTLIPASAYFEDPGDHAGCMETSVMMYLFPDHVLPLSTAGPGGENKFRIEALASGAVWAPRYWKSASTDTGIGNPEGSDAVKGKIFVDGCVEKLADAIIELAPLSNDSLYSDHTE